MVRDRDLPDEANRYDGAPAPDLSPTDKGVVPPSEEEERRRMEEESQIVHAQYRATLALLQRFDVPYGRFHVHAMAEWLGYDHLTKKARRGSIDWSAFRESHEEPHERPDPGERHPQDTRGPPMKVAEKARKLKLIHFMRIQDVVDEIAGIRSARKILNPFGASKARVMVIEYDTGTHRDAVTRRDVFTNRTFGRAMDDEQWSDRFDADRIAEYQQELTEMYHDVVGVGHD